VVWFIEFYFFLELLYSGFWFGLVFCGVGVEALYNGGVLSWFFNFYLSFFFRVVISLFLCWLLQMFLLFLVSCVGLVLCFEVVFLCWLGVLFWVYRVVFLFDESC